MFYYYTALIGETTLEISQEDSKISGKIYQFTIQEYEEGVMNITRKIKLKSTEIKLNKVCLPIKIFKSKSFSNLKLLLKIDY